MFKEFSKNKKGFTLIELVVVMIIIGILVLLATPRFIKYIEQARYTRIVNDIKALESVVVPDMARNNMRFPEGTDENLLCDLEKAAKEDRAYMKDGIIAKGTSKDTEEFKKDFVGNISKVEAEDVKTGFYKLDYKGYVKPEIKTRLKGQFFINKDGDVVYVDGKEVEGIYKDSTEVGGEVDRTGVFRYKSDNPTSPDAGIIVGANVEHEYWDKLKTTTSYRIKRSPYVDEYVSGYYYSAPQFPNTRMVEGELVPVTEIGEDAFNRVLATASNWEDNTHMLNGEFKIGDNVKVIGKNAFKNNNFSGSFEGKNIETIGISAFEESKFSGSFEGRNIRIIENNAFKNSRFSGRLKLPKTTKIGHLAFIDSKFTGKFEAPEVKTIGKGAFYDSEFTGKFEAPELTIIVSSAFYNSKFTDKFEAPEVKTIGSTAFYNSKFTGSFITPELSSLGARAFCESKFNGSFSADKLTTIGEETFRHSEFTGSFDGANLVEVKSNAFHDSKFKGYFNAPKLKKAEHRAFFFSEFTGPFTPDGIERIDWQAFCYSEFTGTLNASNLTNIDRSGLMNSKFEGSFDAPKLGYIYEDALKNSKFTGRFNVPNIRFLGDYALKGSEFGGELTTPKLVSVGREAFLNSKFTGELDTSELYYVGSNGFGRSEFNKIKLSENIIKVDGYKRGMGKCENHIIYGPTRRKLTYLGEAFKSTVALPTFTRDKITILGEDTASAEELVKIEEVKDAIMNNDYWENKDGYILHGTEKIIPY